MTSSKPNSEYDAMIVGGGPAGISTWLHLHKYAPDIAEKTLLIEKAKYPRDKLCGGGVGGWSGHILKRLGADLDIPSIYVSNVEFLYRGEKYNLTQPNSFQMVQRIDFDHAFAKFALQKGLVIKENEAFINFLRKDDKIIVKTDKETYELKVLIGADGALSKIRKNMNLQNKTHLSPTIEIFSAANPKYDKEFEEKKISIDLNPIDQGIQGYIWHVPSIKKDIPTIGHGIVDLNVIPRENKPSLKDVFETKLQQRNLDIKKFKLQSHPIPWPDPEYNFSQPNVLLVGDAAGVEPAFGGGIHFALSYGEVAAKTIIEAYNSNNFAFDNYRYNIKNHYMGKSLDKCMKIANGLYSKKLDPFKAAKEVFTIPK